MKTTAACLFALTFAGCGGVEQTAPAPRVPQAVAPEAPSAVIRAQAAVPVAAKKPTLRELQKTALETALHALNDHDAAKFASIYAETAVVSAAGFNEVSGRAAVEANMAEWFQLFSKVKIGFANVWIRGKTVVLAWVINGTHTGELFGRKMPETPIGHSGISIVTMNDNGLIVSERRYGDLAAVEAQMAGGTRAQVPSLPETMQVTDSNAEPDTLSKEAREAYMLEAFSGYAANARKDYSAILKQSIALDGRLRSAKEKIEDQETIATVEKAFRPIRLEGPGALVFGKTSIVEHTLFGEGPKGKTITMHVVDVVQAGADGNPSSRARYQNAFELTSQLGIFSLEPVVPAKTLNAL
jgi:SnoaL-like polyketide cyclase